MQDAQFRQDLKDGARIPFRQSNPDGFGRAQGDPAMVKKLAAIEQRAGRIKNRVRAHCSHFQDNWTAREAITLWQKRAALVAKHPAPANAPKAELEPGKIMADARRRVISRATNRLSKVNAIKTRMANAVLRTHQDMGPDQSKSMTREFKNRNRMQNTY